ncbi:hypothetical protein EUTSA_v10008982mg [Eutrema salsugineum]|uniref:60S ribosomal protein L18a-like protein n=1 Tax=Eutrema salsugineum TaxID=72664 RepID=V4L5S3_EUTSA|nr:60S ribosomal protein L18a-like protein [Eutrema salsugineum]ESQ35098.1 hypothetical protein EUTSA_v10008982mg [Eutrema salsugineum]
MGQGEEDKSRGFAEEAGNQHHHHQYGTFQGVSNYPPPQNSPPVTGFPQPSPPPGAYDSSAPYYAHGYQTVPVYGGVAEGRPVTVRQRRLPCCGIGLGWFLFIVGFFLGAIPWYIGMFIMIVGRRIDHREKPGYIACTIAAILATIAVILGVSKGAEEW